MNSLFFTRWRLRAVVNAVRSLDRGGWLRVIVVMSLGLSLWTGIFVGSLRGFRFVYSWVEPVLADAVIAVLMGLFFTTMLVMLAFSNAVVAYSGFFRSEETLFLHALPLRSGKVYAYKLMESMLFGSWAFLVLGVPILLGYGIETGARWEYYPLIAAYMVPLVVLPSSIGGLLALLLPGVLNRVKRVPIHAAAIMVVAAAGVFMALSRGRVFGGAFYGPDWARGVLGRFAFLRNPYQPGEWATSGIIALARGRLGEAVLHLGWLSSAALFFYTLGDYVARRAYRPIWQASQDHGRRVREKSRRAGGSSRWSVPGSYSLFFAFKDAKCFVRDPAQWSQMVLFFGLLAVYFLNIRGLGYNLKSPFWRGLICQLNLASISLTLATMTTRFVFPLVSLEGKRFWIAALAPVKRSSIVVSKFVLSTAGSVLVGSGLVVLSNVMLRSSGETTAVQVFTAALVAVGLSGLAVGMGSLFPDFSKDDPSRIVSGFGGTLTLVLAVGFVAAVVGLEGYLVGFVLHAEVMSTARLVFGIAGMLLLTMLAAVLPMKYGIRAIERMDL